MSTPGNTKTIASRLRQVSEEMANLGAEMCRCGDLAEWSRHGQELIGAAQLARQWATAIESEHDPH